MFGLSLRAFSCGSGLIMNHGLHSFSHNLVRTSLAPAPKILDMLGSGNEQQIRQISTTLACLELARGGPWKTGLKRMKQKHWNPKYRPLRRLKVIRVKLPDFRELKADSSGNLTPDQMRSKMKEQGVCPARPWIERQFEISSTGAIFEAYVPPEGEGKASLITPTGAKQTAIDVQKKSKTMMAVRKIKQFEEGFNRSDFLEQALEIYKKMHETMAKAAGVPDEEVFERELSRYATEKAYPELLHNLKCKTIRWKFLESIEPARFVHARCDNVLTNENTFGQVTVRFHTKQTLAIYDRFGRLMYGNELTPKDVLEYVVFEKHLADTYGLWRVHAKIIPEWSGTGHDMSPVRTVRRPTQKPVDEKQTSDKETAASTSGPSPASTSSESPQVATA